ncbi:MAG: RNA-guided endonuclease TnpB family protein [Cyanobacteria bacterium P01_A01_bin.83]
MKARYQYRIYPTSMQQRALAQLFGCVRVVWNDSLALCRMSDKLPKTSALQKVFITLAKKTQDRKWLSDVSNIPLQQSVADLGRSYKNFFAGLKSTRKVGYPKFKKRSNQQSARFTRGGFSIKRNKVYLAKIGLLKTKWSRSLPSKPSSVTVIKDGANRYFLSFVVEVESITKPASRESIGVDLGIKIFAALSNQEKIYSPNYSRLERKISCTQKKLARCVQGSNRREIVRLKLARLHVLLADKRKDFLHKLSTRLVANNKIVVLEDLNVSGMVKNHNLARAIARCGWSMFRTMCQAKANFFVDREVRVIDRWQPTSQSCSSCGYKWGKLDLSVREIVCLGCSRQVCRDANASENIENIGVGHIHDVKRTLREHKTSVFEAILGEASTRKLEWEQLWLPI